MPAQPTGLKPTPTTALAPPPFQHPWNGDSPLSPSAGQRTGATSHPYGRFCSLPHELCPVTVARVAAEKKDMTSSVADVAEGEAPAECRTTEVPCLVCVMTLSLDDDQPKTGIVRWNIVPHFRLKMGTAVSFECPQGHSSKADPELLKAFPSRRFW